MLKEYGVNFVTVTAVIARYKEDTSWTKGLKVDKVEILQKDTPEYPNLGREPTSYLTYIINNYESLNGIYFFSQGGTDHYDFKDTEFTDEFTWYIGKPRCDFKKELYNCDLQGNPHDNIDISLFLKNCNLNYKLNYIVFAPCCLFSISAKDIKRNSKDYYINIHKAILDTKKGEYAFERLVRHIFFQDQDILTQS